MRKLGMTIQSMFTAVILLGSPSIAAGADFNVVETSVYEWTEEPDAESINPAGRTALASFGPFSVKDNSRAELVGIIEPGAASQFRQMLKAFPAISQIDMIDCPGTTDDAENFAIARMIRKAGIATFVPDGGSVRSGGVELFLSGAHRHADPNAEFAVHSWQDEDGREADDVSANDPLNLEYINYYREMGMDAAKAKAFYALTNSVPFDSALYLKASDISAFVTLD
jgi:hypothetical protein